MTNKELQKAINDTTENALLVDRVDHIIGIEVDIENHLKELLIEQCRRATEQEGIINE